MTENVAIDDLKPRVARTLQALRGVSGDADLAVAKALVQQLRDRREYDLMGRLAEAVSRRDPKDARNRTLYAQCLIETGKATVAIDVLRPLVQRLPRRQLEYLEAAGLLGRAHKQIFIDAGDKTHPAAREALRQAVLAYRAPYEDDRSNTWHGVNLLALLVRARRLGLRVAPDLHPADLARELRATLDGTPAEQRHAWFLPTLAEVALGLGDWDAVERDVRAFAAAPDANAFQVASTLRQFRDVWDLETSDERGRGLVTILQARLAQLPGGTLELRPEDVQRLREQAAPSAGQLEAVLGSDGPQAYRWWKTGLDRAVAVAAVRQRLGGRIGTAFLVRAGDLGREPADERLVVTNFHVVNEHGASPGIRPDEAEIAFEAVDGGRTYGIDRILWTSPPDRHDASVLRLSEPVTGVDPLPVDATLPPVEETARVYIIGHPGGRDLAFSFQDNALLDHEGPPTGLPRIPGVCRVHYRAPTEGGSSGSPVFDARQWRVIALHHAGGRLGIPRLNGREGTYPANEGIAIGSIISAQRE